MAQIFPRTFDSSLMRGASAIAFETNADAFQQLIGDGLRAMSGHNAHCFPTKGNDGSIDSYLNADASLDKPFQKVLLPAIIECKYHNSSLPRLADNIWGEWRKVKKKLFEQAANGWYGLSEPWKDVKSYVYIVGTVIPNEKLWKKLVTEIENFFGTLSGTGSIGIEKVIVLDWNDISEWLNRYSNVRDSWLGTEDPSIISLSVYKAGLTGFRRFLEPSNLPFIMPDDDARFKPDIILDALTRKGGEKTGILLVGAGGVGKTRTSYEVAILAERTGWRVLYALPDRSPVTSEQIAKAILNQPAVRTLLIIEYLDQMPYLDIRWLRTGLVPLAREAGNHVAVLANSRPGLIWKLGSDHEACFERIDMILSDVGACNLSKWAVEQTAPLACRVLSQQEILRVCGSRPIIALLVAQQLENLAVKGLLTPETTAPIRHGDPLGHWLHKRLSEDAITSVQSTSYWVSPVIPPHMVAAATILASSPDDIDGLKAAGNASLQRLKSKYSCTKVIDGLIDLGWLERSDSWYVAVHDVVADEVVEQTIFENDSVRSEEFSAILSAAEKDSRSFGRIAKSLNRVHGATSVTRQQSIVSCLQEWISGHALNIGDTIAHDAPTHGSYALGAAIGSPIFEESVLKHWDDLVTPWLTRYETDFEARHLLYKGLRVVTGSVLVGLTEIALKWLSRWRLEQASSYVINSVLRYSHLHGDDLQSLINWSLEWLKHYCHLESAGFILSTILANRDITEENLMIVLSYAERWLSVFGANDAALFTFVSLLHRHELETETVERVAVMALVWLAKFGHRENAWSIISLLILRTDISKHSLEGALKAATAWLETHGLIPKARHVLLPLLRAKNGMHEHSSIIVDRTMAWLGAVDNPELNRPVLIALLRRSSGKTIEQGKLFLRIFEWLVGKSGDLYEGIVLSILLRKKNIGESETHELINRGAIWVEKNFAERDAGIVFSPLLKRKDLKSPIINSIVRSALLWLIRFNEEPESSVVIRRLIRLEYVMKPESYYIELLAIEWLNNHKTFDEYDLFLATVLKHLNYNESSAQEIGRIALEWLDEKKESLEAGTVLCAFTRSRYLSEYGTGNFVCFAISWLAKWGMEPTADVLLARMLFKEGVSADQKKFIINASLRWISNWRDREDAIYLLLSFYSSPLVCPSQRILIDEAAAHWLARWKNAQAGGPFLLINFILSAEKFATVERRAWFTRVHSWISIHRSHQAAPAMLCILLEQRGLLMEEIDSLILIGLDIGWRYNRLQSYRILKLVLGQIEKDSSIKNEVEVCLEHLSHGGVVYFAE